MTTLEKIDEAEVAMRFLAERGACSKPVDDALTAAKSDLIRLEAERKELREALYLVKRRWTFSEDQQPTHTWHDREDCMEVIRKALAKVTT